MYSSEPKCSLCSNTLDFKAVGRVFGVPTWLTGDLFDSTSRDGKSGVPGGVRSLKVNNFIVRQLYNNFKTADQKSPPIKFRMQQNELELDVENTKVSKICGVPHEPKMR